jgi:hypothetical protein
MNEIVIEARAGPVPHLNAQVRKAFHPTEIEDSWLSAEPNAPKAVLSPAHLQRRKIMGRGILLWLLGVPIPIIILLALVWH